MYYFRDRFDIPLTDKQVENLEFYRPNEKSDEIQYLKERRKARWLYSFKVNKFEAN